MSVPAYSLIKRTQIVQCTYVDTLSKFGFGKMQPDLSSLQVQYCRCSYNKTMVV